MKQTINPKLKLIKFKEEIKNLLWNNRTLEYKAAITLIPAALSILGLFYLTFNPNAKDAKEEFISKNYSMKRTYVDEFGPYYIQDNFIQEKYMRISSFDTTKYYVSQRTRYDPDTSSHLEKLTRDEWIYRINNTSNLSSDN